MQYLTYLVARLIPKAQSHRTIAGFYASRPKCPSDRAFLCTKSPCEQFLAAKKGTGGNRDAPGPPHQFLERLDYAVLLEQLLDVCALDLAERGLKRLPFDERQLHVSDLTAVLQLGCSVKQATHIVDGAPDLGGTTIHIAQRVDGLHAGAHGVLGGEDGVARDLANCPIKAKLTAPSGTTLGLSVSFLGMKKAVM